MEMETLIRKCLNIYSHLADDISRQIFESRVLFSLTGNYLKLRPTITSTPEGEMICSILNSDDEFRENYIFGAGLWGRSLEWLWPEKFKGFIDNDLKLIGNTIDSFPVKSVNEMKNFSGRIFIGSKLHYREMIEQLISIGIERKQIVHANFQKMGGERTLIYLF